MEGNKKILVVVTGQLRNASENLENWLEKLNVPGADVYYLFYIWDVIGSVDPSKMYLRCLRTKNENEIDYTEVSENNVYFKKQSDISSEIYSIKDRLHGKCEFVIEKYKDEYLYKAGRLEIGERLKADAHPWWQGVIPVAYINHLALELVKNKYNYFDFYIRLQTEAFLENVVFSESVFKDSNLILTSPDTINRDSQVSMKFFAGKLGAFSELMDAYRPSIKAFKDYECSVDSPVPIGERYLWYLAKRAKFDIRYEVRMKVTRQLIVPEKPVWRPTSKVRNEWTIPNLIDLPNDEFARIAKQTTVFQEA